MSKCKHQFALIPEDSKWGNNQVGQLKKWFFYCIFCLDIVEGTVPNSNTNSPEIALHKQTKVEFTPIAPEVEE